MALAATDAIAPAMEHTKQQLLRPFRFSQWWRLALVGLLAGEGGSSFNFNTSVPSRLNTPQPHTSDQTTLLAQIGGFWELVRQHAVLIAVLIVAIFFLGILFTYIASVMRFVLFDSIVNRKCQIRRGWRFRKREGLRLFLWQLGFGVVILVSLAFVIGLPALAAWRMGWFKEPGEHLVPLILGGIFLFFALAALVIVAAVITVMTKDFVVPQMAFEPIGTTEGWRRLLRQVAREKGGYAAYIGMKIVLTIAAAIMTAIAAILAVLIVLIPVAAVAAACFFGGRAMGLTWNFFTIGIAVVFGCAGVLSLLFFFLLIAVPTYVFFPAYSIYFFAGRFPPLAAAIWPSPPPMPPPSAPPPSAPPLPPQPAPIS